MIGAGFTRGQRAHGADYCNHSGFFIALGCDGMRPGEELPLSANVSLPSGEIWTRFMWERFAASPSTAAFNALHASKEPRRS